MFESISSFRKALEGLVLAAALSGCYSPTKVVSQPSTSVSLQPDFVRYVSDLHSRCGAASLEHQEELFRRYIIWENQLSGIWVDPENLTIVPDNPVSAFISSGPIGLASIGGTFLYGHIRIRQQSMNLSAITHEVGHGTDLHLNYLGYIFSQKTRVRVEAVAESFEHYVGLEHIRNGNLAVGLGHLMARPTLPAGGTRLDELIDGNTYDAARSISFILMNQFGGIKDTWRFLSVTPENGVYENVQNVILEKGIGTAILSGYDICEREKAEVLRLGSSSSPVSVK